jgi:hypothetical protein
MIMAGNKGTSGQEKHNYPMVGVQQTVDAAATDAGKGGNMLGRYIGATVAIVAMWLAVLLVGIYGPDFVSDGTTVNTAAMLAPFAMGGTITVAINGYRP